MKQLAGSTEDKYAITNERLQAEIQRIKLILLTKNAFINKFPAIGFSNDAADYIAKVTVLQKKATKK